MTCPVSRDVLPWSSATSAKVLVVGDIHGEVEMFKRLLAHANYDEKRDFVYALGDIVDRGPDSRAVLDWFASGFRRKSLIGNHEALMVESATDWNTGRVWNSNGGHWAQSLSHRDLFLYRCMLKTFPLTAEIQYDDGYRVGLVHADIPPRTSWQQMAKVRLAEGEAIRDFLDTRSVTAVWGRSRFRAAMHFLGGSNREEITVRQKIYLWDRVQPIKGIDMVVSGHTVIADHQPFGLGNMMWIETGAAYDGRLTAIDPKSKMYWQVGKSAGEVWGPLRLPEPTPLDRSWRPTKQERAQVSEDASAGGPPFERRRIRIKR